MIRIEATNLTKRFRGNVVALNNLSFNLEGRIIALVGPNGSGKTTLLSILVGLRRPTMGRLFLNGFEPYVERERALKTVSFTFEKPRFNIGITVQQLLRILAEKCPDSDELLDYVKVFGLDDSRNKKLHELSSGQAQLLALAIALFCDKKKIAVLDEPLAHLDIANRAKLIDVMSKRSNIIFTTHVIEEAEAIADSAAILNNGACVWHGSLANMYREDIYEVFVRRDKLEILREAFGERILADLGLCILVRAIDRDVLDDMVSRGVILGYRRAGLKVQLYERLKSGSQALHQ